MATTSKTMKPAVSYVMVHNIPKTYRASDLRNFFSQIVETGGFRCFHYRHRPEVQKPAEDNTIKEASGSAHSTKFKSGETCCAVVMVRTERLDELKMSYNKAFWVTREGETLTSRCYLRKVVIANDDTSKSSSLYLPPVEERERRPKAVLTLSDLRQMIELRPPAALPAGNVGTPTNYILRQINACNFPASLIGKLGIEFPRMRARGMYGSVPLDYSTKLTDCRLEKAGKTDNDPNEDQTGLAFIVSEQEEQAKNIQNNIDQSDNSFKKSAFVARPFKCLGGTRIIRPKCPPPDLSSIPSAEEVPTFIRTGKGYVISRSALTAKRSPPDPGEKFTLRSGSKKQSNSLRTNYKEDERAIDDDNESTTDSDDGEEWDRYESLHNDVTSQERTKARLFEEEQEVVWEKGGSGLVFYTDAQVWDEAEGDFDAKTSDDWDIDMSAYYINGAGDKDAKDFISMQHFKRLREGKADDDDNRVGYFEKFTRGFGRRMLERQGWSDGRGVGKSKEGPSEPIESEGQHPRDRSGLGYRGEKLDRRLSVRRNKRERQEDFFSSIYDEYFAAGEDPGRHDRHARSQEPTLLKYRKVFVKTSAVTPEATN
ncbi:G patch domain-containing protein 3-like [Varroa jacobsoni]|uniref:G patch domain-containing protein 3-like n=1 Tax=Varroa jacobsoni TaxID=62625 RepID=UPI000BF2F0FF|nr:G patch domain-containing protein 3-like [Varroa jacobsoni]